MAQKSGVPSRSSRPRRQPDCTRHATARDSHRRAVIEIPGLPRLDPQPTPRAHRKHRRHLRRKPSPKILMGVPVLRLRARRPNPRTLAAGGSAKTMLARSLVKASARFIGFLRDRLDRPFARQLVVPNDYYE